MKIIALLLISVALVGCAGPQSYTNREPAAAGSISKNAWTRVRVVSMSQLKRDYEIIGEIKGDSDLENMKWIKQQAARMGADAVSLCEGHDAIGWGKYYALKFR